MASERMSPRRESIAAYKQILRDCLDQRPSGARLRIARVLGTHKSFVSQITNPADPTPLPARHLTAIFDVVNLSKSERARFLEAYRAAHPTQRAQVDPDGGVQDKILQISVPVLSDPQAQHELEQLIRDFARRTGTMLANREARGEPSDDS